MKLQVLMSTMNLKPGAELPIGLKEIIKDKVKCTVINQCSENKTDFNLGNNNIQIFSFTEKGISKSRNRNLELLKEDIALITDQDIRFKKGFHEVICTAFEQSPEADIIAFQIEDERGKLLKNYMKKPFWMNQRDIMKVSSVEIAFKAKSILDNNILFDESFGLGSTFPTGEEAIFLSGALEKGLKIKFVPRTIVIHPRYSSGHLFEDNQELIVAKGAMLQRIFGNKAFGITIIFALKKYRKSSESFLNFVRLMFKGISSFKELHGK